MGGLLLFGITLLLKQNDLVAGVVFGILVCASVYIISGGGEKHY